MTTDDLECVSKKVVFYTCKELFLGFRNEGQPKYKSLPDDFPGLKVEAEFSDTLEWQAESSGVVLCLHGSPGSFIDFRSITNDLSQKNLRAISLGFPTDEVLNGTNLFSHSGLERSEFIADFLVAINVNRIDMLICHSSGTLSAVEFINRKSKVFQIDSLILLNPIGPFWHHVCDNDINAFLLRILFRTYETKVGKWMLSILTPPILKLLGSHAVYKTFDDLIFPNMVMKMDHAAREKHITGLKKIVESGLPIFLVYGEQDNIIPNEYNLDMVDILAAPKESFTVYDKELKEIRTRDASKLPCVLVFQGGGHYSFSKYSQIVNPMIEEFFQLVKSKKQ